MATTDTSTQSSLTEDNLAAQRAAAEAVQIGRATIEQVAVQGEQLNNASRMADEAQYVLDKSARYLRGMTWGGWLQNIVSRDVKLPSDNSHATRKIEYDAMPEAARATAQAIQNYQANLSILNTCETKEQQATCQLVCDNMYGVASKELSMVMTKTDSSLALVKHKLKKDLAYLRTHQQMLIQENSQKVPPAPPASAFSDDKVKESLVSKSPMAQVQEEHLDLLSEHLGELTNMATSLNEMIGQQQSVVNNLDDKTDCIQSKTEMVTRRADRLVNKKSFSPKKKSFHSNVTIQSLASGLYLSADSKGNLILVGEPSIFGKWNRKASGSGLFGLQHKKTEKWAGQSYFTGGMACSARSFGQKEEWQAVGDNMDATPLVIASAGWGQGGFLKESASHGLSIVKEKSDGGLWCLKDTS